MKAMKSKLLVLGLVAAISMIPSKVSAEEKELVRGFDPDKYYDACVEVGERYGICPEILQAIMFTESSGNPNATSAHGAQGLCQIIPKWHKKRMERLGVTDLYDPYSNLVVCADIIMESAEKHEDLYCVLAVYNEGEYGGAIEKYESGNYSKYAIKITELAFELERAHGK